MERPAPGLSFNLGLAQRFDRHSVRRGPPPDTIGPMVSVEFERVEALELLGMTLAHLNDAEARGEVSPRVPVLMNIRDKLAIALREKP